MRNSGEKLILGRRRRLGYTDGELNKIVDGLVHPKARKDLSYWAWDALLHGIIEQDPEVTVEKFIEYNIPEIIKQTIRTKRPRKVWRTRKAHTK